MLFHVMLLHGNNFNFKNESHNYLRRRLPFMGIESWFKGLNGAFSIRGTSCIKNHM